MKEKYNKVLKIMKISIFMLFLCIFSVSAENIFSQQAEVSVSLKNVTLKKAISEIEKVSDYVFLISDEARDELNNKTSIKANKESINRILSDILDDTNLDYRITGRQVSIYKSSNTNSSSTINTKIDEVKQKKIVVNGIVTDTSGETLIGASVLLKGTEAHGTVTDIDGKYSISNIPPDGTLIFTYIGMRKKEVSINGNTTLNVTLEEDTELLDEVIVTAFGTGQKKETMVGSIQTVNPSELRVPSANLSTSFAGRMAGVISYQRTGQPGADGASFYIRGISTIGGATSPLIVLDGVEISAGDLNTLDPEIIEGFSILKDATATAMYGSRGANGVMIVTTKTGSDLRKPVINFRVEANVAQPTSKIKLADGTTFMNLFNEATNNLGTMLPFSQDKIYGTENNLNQYVYPNVNWYDELFKNSAFNQKVNFNIRGGGKKADYFSSISVTHETGLLQNRSKDYYSFNNNIDVMRYNLQNNINAYLGESSKFSLRLNVNLMDKKGPNTDVNNLYGNIMNMNPVDFPISYPDDPELNYRRWGGFSFGSNPAYNPMATFVSGYQTNFTSTVVANLQYDQGLDFITEGLSMSGLVSFKNWSSTSTYRSAPYNMFVLSEYVRNPEDNNVEYDVERVGNEVIPVLGTTGGTTGDRWFYIQANLDWRRTFGLHDVNALLIYNQEQFNYNAITGDTSIQRLYSALPQRGQSLAGRASYVYDNKYMVEFNFGYNGSENFAKGNRFGFFPSVAAGYNISMEPWFEPALDVVSYLKLRGSWGLVGNDRIGGERFLYMSSVNLNGARFTTGLDQNYSLSGPVYSRYPNYGLTWETGEKINFGLDLHILRDWKLVADFFRENRSNIFQQRGTIPTYLGTANTAVYANTAAVRNQGFDLSLDYGKKIDKDWTIQFKGTFSFAQNKVTKYDEPSDQQYPNLMNVGYPLNTHLGYVADGLFIDWADVNNWANQQISGNVAPGDIKYKDIADKYGETDGLITSSDRVRMGYPTVPEIIYGFGPSIQYKNFDFGFLLQGAARTSMMLSGMHPFGTNTRRNVMQWIVDDHWSPDNQNINAGYPRLTQTDHGNNTAGSSFWLRDASFLKLKNAEIGYTYKNMRIYLSGSNLLTFSKFKLWDPEQGGGSGLKYPTTRVINAGFQMTIN